MMDLEDSEGAKIGEVKLFFRGKELDNDDALVRETRVMEGSKVIVGKVRVTSPRRVNNVGETKNDVG